MNRLFAFVFVTTVSSTPALAFDSLGAQADYYQDLYGNPSSSTKITTTDMNKGETRPKAVLKGVFYFGGSDVKKQALSSNYQKRLCENGFSEAFSVYTSVDTSMSCDAGVLEYNHIGQAKAEADGGSRVGALMQKIYDVIKADGAQGPIYVHCYYGVHASNTIAQMVQKQFCGISDETAYSNWDKVNLYNSLPAPGPAKEKAKIAAYEIDANLALTDAEKAVVCY